MTVEPIAPPASDDALTRLVGDRDRFEAEHWGRRPLLRRGAWGGRPPLVIEDVDHLLTAAGLRWPAFRVVREGRTLPRSACTRSGRIGGRGVDDLADAARILEHVRQGATLVLQALHRYHPPVTDLCRDLQAALGHPVQANAYLTPPDARGLNVHHDTHDVLALQTHGHKHWVVHEPAVEVPLPSQAWSADEHRPGALVLDARLAPGDLLYLPRGAAHAAETVGEVSLHLTLGVRAVTWHDVLRRAVRRLGEADPSLREALPLGYADDLHRLEEAIAVRLAGAAQGLAEVPVDELAAELVDDRRRSAGVDLRGQLLELLALEEIEQSTVVRRRPGVRSRVTRDGEQVVLDLPDRELRLPAGVEPALRQVLDGSPHRVADLDGPLDADGRLVLARRLVREGALVTDGPDRG